MGLRPTPETKVGGQAGGLPTKLGTTNGYIGSLRLLDRGVDIYDLRKAGWVL
jgi:hypothetical protein